MRLPSALAPAALAALTGGATFAGAQTPAPVVPLAAPGAPVAEVAPAPPAAPAEGECGACKPFDWKAVPRIRPLPRPGFFQVPPTGPGYYSLLDQLRGDCSQAPPKFPYPRFGAFQQPFFDADNFGYLDDPKNTETDLFDPLKRIHPTPNTLFVTGGELRDRYENRTNDRLGQRDNVYNLSRVRLYGDLWYKDDLRLYAEFIGAYTSNQDLRPLPTDENKADFLNLFVDAKLFEIDGKPAYVRVGRQELLFGSQRLISPLDWANTRRTFQGVRGFRQGEKLDVDFFWAQPVVPNANKLDSVDNNQNFAGAWATYRPAKGRSIDAYYLVLDNTSRVTQLGLGRAPFTRHTFGGRYAGSDGNFLFDTELAMQLGVQDRQTVVAGMATQGLGYNFKGAPLNPTVWAYYDYASGGRGGANHTFNQLFPFGHYYLGWLDQVGRQNIHDLNFHLYTYPAPWLTTWLQFHSFWLADSKDALYNAAGNAIRRDARGRSGSHVGEEIDAVANFHLTKHADVLLGYSQLFGGEFLRNTRTANASSNSAFFFLQTSYRW